MDYIVTRHDETDALVRRMWPRRMRRVSHVDAAFLARLRPGDTVIGNLPAPLLADICDIGAIYLHIELDLAPEQRGRELPSDELRTTMPRLTPVQVTRGGQKPPGRTPFALPRFRLPALRFFGGFLLMAVVAGALDFSFVSIGRAFSGGGAWSVRAIDLVWAVGALAVASLVAWRLWQLRGRIMHFSVRPSRYIPPRRVLIQGLSPLRQGDRAIGGEMLEEAANAFVDLGFSTLAGPSDVHDRALFRAWRQNARAIYPHLERLERILVLCSPGEEGSEAQFKSFQSAMERVLRAEGSFALVERAPGGAVDFEDHDTLRARLHDALEHAERRYGAGSGEASIDVTAGQKIFSITAAAVTINREMVFTYVNNQGEVTSFDASLELGDWS